MPTVFSTWLDRTAPWWDDFLRGSVVAPIVVVVVFTSEMFAVAADAFDRYGKGRGHRAQLNFGDCLAYAVAKVQNVPLLYKGADFARTDIRPALQ